MLRDSEVVAAERAAAAKMPKFQNAKMPKCQNAKMGDLGGRGSGVRILYYAYIYKKSIFVSSDPLICVRKNVRITP